MTTRSSTSLLFAIAAAAVITCGSAFAFTACSSPTSSSVEVDASSGDAAPDARRVVDAADVDSGATQTVAECQAACDTKFPSSVPKYNAVDTCWAANCTAECIDGTSTAYDAGAYDGGALTSDGGGNGLCGTKVGTGDPPPSTKACDDCTEINCCAEWKGCYADTSCLDYNTCVNDCQALAP
jgi:hypothetical protein